MERRRDKKGAKNSVWSAKRRHGSKSRANRKSTANPMLGDVDSQDERDEAAIGASRDQFCKYLTSARERSGKTLEEIATKTRIPKRSLERLETGDFESLPADVFVRGFLRSYARCVGLDEADAIKRYATCGMTPAPVASAMADELASAMASLEASAGPQLRAVRAQPAEPEAIVPAAPAEHTSARSKLAQPVEHTTGVESETASVRERVVAPEKVRPVAVSEPMPVVSGDDVVRPVADDGAVQPVALTQSEPATPDSGRESHTARSSVAGPDASKTASKTETSESAAVSSSASKSRNARKRSRKRKKRKGQGGVATKAAKSARSAARAVGPKSESAVGTSASSADAVAAKIASQPTVRSTLVIDDADPDRAEAERSARQGARSNGREDTNWKNFIPPSLLDSEQGSRRGALTLAVIILVIVATLTMSYLMRQPNESGDGVTRAEPALNQPVIG